MLRARPDDKQRANIVRYMELAIQQGSITPADAMYFTERIEAGEDITEIRQEIAYSIQKAQEQTQADQQSNIQAQNEGLAMIEDKKAQNQAALLQLEGQNKMTEEVVRNQGKGELLRKEQNYQIYNDARIDMMLEQGLTPNTTSK